MAVDTGRVRDQLEQRANSVNSNGAESAVLSSPSVGQTIAAYLKKMESQIAQVLPKHITPDRLTRIALTTIRTNQNLLKCELPSLLAAVMQAAQLGLEPGLLGHCYIIPYGKEATFVIGYKGMIDLARRSGEIQSINAHEVYFHDFLDVEYGLQENLRHIPWHIRTDETFTEPGDLRGFYMVAKFKDGGHYIHYMSKHEVDQHRARSKAANAGPWKTDYIEMGKKTVVRSGWKWLPISIEIADKVASADETSRPDIASLSDDAIDISYQSMPDNNDKSADDAASPS